MRTTSVRLRSKYIVFWIVILIVPIVLVVFLSAEIYLRATFQAYSDKPLSDDKGIAPDQKVGWKNKPVDGLINSRGFRNTVEFAVGKSDNTRVMMIGDSILFSYFFTDNPRSLTDYLHDRAKNESLAAEFMNLSSSGYSTYQERLLFEEYFPLFCPDIVVVAYCLNDTYPTKNPFLNLEPMYEHWKLDEDTERIISNPVKNQPFPLLTIRWLNQHWPIFLRGYYRSFEKDISKRFYDGNREPQKQHFIVVDDLRAIKKTTDAVHARLIIIIYPRRQEVVENKRLKDAGFLMKELGVEFEVYDLFHLFRKRFEGGSLDFLSEDDAHPNHIGQELVAEYLYPLLMSEKRN